MKKLLLIALGFTALTALAQEKSVDLRWKIAKDEKLNYTTVMSEIDTSTTEVNFEGFFKDLSDSSGVAPHLAKNFFKDMSRSIQDLDYVSSLTSKGNGVVDIVMYTVPKPENAEKENSSEEEVGMNMAKMMQRMTNGVMLRGSVFATGGMHSFWVKSDQKNLISLLFELPAKPVKVGDKWSLDIQLISNDQNFECDSSYKLNEVTLTDIKTVNGETIAVLNYQLVEYVQGNYTMPAFFGDKSEVKKTTMKFVFQGLAEFSIDKGRWISYEGNMGLDSSGVMTSHKKTRFALINEKKEK